MAGCPVCGGSVIEYDPAEGNSVCTNCGYVADENGIVAEVTFGEASTGAAIVEGGYLGANDVRGRMTGPRGRQQSAESREQTLERGKVKLCQLARALNLGDAAAEQAHRWFVLAVSQGFVQGRRSIYVLASCLYVACRMGNLPTMLIDISDLLQVNVFVLGSTYLRLVKDLHVEGIPVSDPSIYISRFASMLDFGDDTQRVALDATRLVKRFKTDWMSAGRRPAGIAGACLLLAARMNNFRRSTLEIVQVVKIADVTLKKRLEEFKKTPSGQMTVADFRNVWLEEAADPPAFSEGLKRAKAAAEAAAELAGVSLPGHFKRNRAASMTLEGLDTGVVTTDVRGRLETAHGQVSGSSQSPKAKGKGKGLQFLAPSGNKGKRKAPFDPEESHPPGEDGDFSTDHFYENHPELEAAIADEVNTHLESDMGELLSHELDERETRRLEAANAEENRLDNLDEEELDGFLLDDKEVEIKTRVWMEFNKDYLEKLADKKAREASGELKPTKPRGKRQKVKARDSANPAGATTSESVRKMIQSKKKFSKKINYSIADQLFGDGSDPSTKPPTSPTRGGRSSSAAGGWGEPGRGGRAWSEAVSSRVVSRYGSPSSTSAATAAAADSAAGSPYVIGQMDHQALFKPAPDEDDEDEEDEEDEEEQQGEGRVDDDEALFRRMRAKPADDDYSEGEV